MNKRSLRVTYRKGSVFAAYLHLSHSTDDKSVRTVPSKDGLVVVDYADSGRPVGIEIIAPRNVTLEGLNRLLGDLGEPPLAEQEFKRLQVA